MMSAAAVVAGGVFIFAAAAGAASMTPALPLLDAPINATWAANYAEDWREKGFRGFLFEGLLDDLSLFPSEVERATRRANSPIVEFATVADAADDEGESPASDPITPVTTSAEQIIPGDWEALVSEIRGAVNRLKSGGLDRNFLRLTIAPEAAYFTDPFLREAAESRFRLAGTFCALTGLRGIAIDTQSQSAIHDYRWDGYPPDATPEALEAGARRFGRRALRAFIRACPEGEILLLARTPETVAPLWFAFLDGALESVGAADTIPIRLVIRDDGAPGADAAYRERPMRLGNLLRATLSQSALRHWERQGGVIFSLEPVYYERDMPTAAYPLAAYRRALYAAALYGRDYVVIAAPEGGWWHIPPDTAAQFGHLRQKGRARVTFAPPVPMPLDAYAPRLRIADAAYIGAMSTDGINGETLHNDNGAMLLLWDGLPDGLRIPGRTSVVVATNLETDERHYYTPQAGEIVVPAQSGLQLIEGLPMRSFALPAAMNMQLRTPLVAGITRAEMEIGLSNPLTLPLRGTLALGAETQYALGAATVALNLAPGESTIFRRTVQGISYLGQRPVFSMHLHIAAEAPLTRSFSFPVEPPETHRMRLDGPIMGAPVALWQAGRKTPDIIAGDARGGLVCFDAASNNALWRIRVRGRYPHPPLVIRNAEGVPYIATQNEHGRLRLYGMDGTEKVVVYPAGGTFTGMTAIALPESAGSCLATASDGRAVSIYTTSGTLKGRFERTDVIHYLASDNAMPGYLFLVASDSGNPAERANPFALAAYTTAGVLAWETGLPLPVSCPPIFPMSPEDNRPLICLGDLSGDIQCYDAHDGRPLAMLPGETDAAATGMAAFVDSADGSLLIAQAQAASLTLHALQWSEKNYTASVRWTLPFSPITALAALPDNSGVVAGLASGSVIAVGVDGRVLWEEHRGAGAVSGLTVYADTTGRDVYTCIAASQSGMIRGLEIRRALIAATGN